MKAEKMCPISKGICTKCSLYIGRHYLTCMTHDDSSIKYVSNMVNTKLNETRRPKDGRYGCIDASEVPSAGTWYHNIEDVFLVGED